MQSLLSCCGIEDTRSSHDEDESSIPAENLSSDIVDTQPSFLLPPPPPHAWLAEQKMSLPTTIAFSPPADAIHLPKRRPSTPHSQTTTASRSSITSTPSHSSLTASSTASLDGQQAYLLRTTSSSLTASSTTPSLDVQQVSHLISQCRTLHLHIEGATLRLHTIATYRARSASEPFLRWAGCGGVRYRGGIRATEGNARDEQRGREIDNAKGKGDREVQVRRGESITTSPSPSVHRYNHPTPFSHPVHHPLSRLSTAGPDPGYHAISTGGSTPCTLRRQRIASSVETPASALSDFTVGASEGVPRIPMGAKVPTAMEQNSVMDRGRPNKARREERRASLPLGQTFLWQ